jgi:hypothetical protein
MHDASITDGNNSKYVYKLFFFQVQILLAFSGDLILKFLCTLKQIQIQIMACF